MHTLPIAAPKLAQTEVLINATQMQARIECCTTYHAFCWMLGVHGELSVPGWAILPQDPERN